MRRGPWGYGKCVFLPFFVEIVAYQMSSHVGCYVPEGPYYVAMIHTLDELVAGYPLLYVCTMQQSVARVYASLFFHLAGRGVLGPYSRAYL